MAENVYHVLQFGRESTIGTAVAATTVFPADPTSIELDRASRYATEDRGRNAAAHPSRGTHGARGATMPLAGEVRFEDIMHILEMHHAGGVTPTGSGPYVWVYKLEAGTSTLKSYTIEEGSDTSQDQWRMIGSLVDELTLEYDALTAPGNAPWRFSGTAVGFDREANALTSALSAPSTLETAEGHLTVLKMGSTATAFGSLSEVSASLIRYSQTTNRNLVRRIYGSTSDKASGWGFSDKTAGTFEMLVKIAAGTKTDLHDVWNSAGGALGEKRFRIEAVGSGTKKLQVDFRGGITAVPIEERDGERVYQITGSLVDDSTLDAPQAITVTNSVAALT